MASVPLSGKRLLLSRRPRQPRGHHPQYLWPRAGKPLIVSCGLYKDGRKLAEVHDIPASLSMARAEGGFVWIGLWEPTEAEFADIAAKFELPALAVEDAIAAHQRPKLERYDDLAFAVVKPVQYLDGEMVEVSELAVFLGPNFVITVRHGRTDIPATARAALEADPEVLADGPVAVLHKLLDLTVDQYLEALPAIEVDIDEIEEQVFGGDSSDHSERIYRLKRQMLDFRRAAVPLVSALASLAEDDHPELDVDATRLFRDVYDHGLRVSDSIESFNTMLTDILQADLAQVSVRQNEAAARQNEDMRKISAWAAIGLVPTAIAGIYGMNFENIPELHWQYGYFGVIGLIGTSCVTLYVTFRRNGWL